MKSSMDDDVCCAVGVAGERERRHQSSTGDCRPIDQPTNDENETELQVLLADPANDLMPRVLFLTNEVGIDMDDLPKVIEAFPLIFGISLEQQMVPALEYLRGLGIADADITKICRAFPSLLGLEVDRHFEPSINFLNEIGIQNVARFVTRIPPVLGYDVENDLRPKVSDIYTFQPPPCPPALLYIYIIYIYIYIYILYVYMSASAMPARSSLCSLLGSYEMAEGVAVFSGRGLGLSRSLAYVFARRWCRCDFSQMS